MLTYDTPATSHDMGYLLQGFQSGPVPGTFTRLRSCIVPAEITEPPKLAVVKTTSMMVDRLVEYFS